MRSADGEVLDASHSFAQSGPRGSRPRTQALLSWRKFAASSTIVRSPESRTEHTSRREEDADTKLTRVALSTAHHVKLSNSALSPVPPPQHPFPPSPQLRNNQHPFVLTSTTIVLPLLDTYLTPALPQMPYRPDPHVVHHIQRLHRPTRARLPRLASHPTTKQLPQLHARWVSGCDRVERRRSTEHIYA